MQISIAKDIVNFKAVEIAGPEELANLALENNFSPAVFKDNYRSLSNFTECNCIGMDIDNDPKQIERGKCEFMSIEDAEDAFSEYMHVIMPSRNHRKEKHGVTTDRFRVILFLTEPIRDIDTFYATWFSLKDKWPAIDNQCKNADRFYWPHQTIYSIKEKGMKIEPVVPEQSELDAYLGDGEDVNLEEYDEDIRGRLAKATREFLETGVEEGERNSTVHKVAKDMQQNLYSRKEAESRIMKALEFNGVFAPDFTPDEALRTIRSAFSKPPRHKPRF